MSGSSSLESAFLTYWHVLAPGAPEPDREYRWGQAVAGTGPGIRSRLRALGLRDWRWDFAWPRPNGGGVAVEVHGGTWQQGRHTRGAGFADDREKINSGTLRGWTVVELTGDMLHSDPVRWIGAIRDAVAATSGEEGDDG